MAGLRPGAGRPTDLKEKVTPGQLGDFLGMDNVRPRPQRPDWQKLGPDRVTNIHNEWNVAVNKNSADFQNWNKLHPERANYWHGWGAGVQANWGGAASRPWFNDTWWATHPVQNGYWHYGYRSQPWQYWWSIPTWAAVTSWYPAASSTQGSYYDYGTGGNVVYENNRVLIDGQDVASSEEFAQSAAELATVEPPADDQAAAAADWLPLGTFALSRSPDDDDLSRIVQLAVDKNGVVSGTLYNCNTDKTYTLQGRIDKQTQRVALMMADRTDLVLETGLYNLTQEEAPAMIHFGSEKSEPALLVRLKQPEDSGKKS